MGGVDVRGVPGDRPERRQRVPRPGTQAAEGGWDHGAQHARDRLLDTGINIRGRAQCWYALIEHLYQNRLSQANHKQINMDYYNSLFHRNISH